MNRRLIWSYVLLVAFAIAGFTVPVAITLTSQLRGDIEITVRREALTAAFLMTSPDSASRTALQRLALAYSTETPGRLDTFNAAGGSITDAKSTAGEDVMSAIKGGKPSTHWGYSNQIKADGLTHIVPVRDAAGTIQGAVRVIFPTEPLKETSIRIWGFRAALAVVVLLLAAALGVIFARHLTRPLRDLNRMALRLRDGDLTARAAITGPEETKELGRTLNTATATISSLLQSQQDFVANASHQLRTPLTALQLSLENIADEVSDPRVIDDVDRASGEVKRMSAIVSGLLQLARAEGHGVRWEAVNVSKLLLNRQKVWQASASAAGVRIETLQAPSELNVSARVGSLEQVLDNILSNAIAVSPRGGYITLDAILDADSITIDICDEGPGMSEAERTRAMERFWRGAASTGSHGSGLGLSIAQQIMQDNHGQLSLGEAESGGLSVRMTLPKAVRTE